MVPPSGWSMSELPFPDFGGLASSGLRVRHCKGDKEEMQSCNRMPL